MLLTHFIYACSGFSYVWIALDRFLAIASHNFYRQHCTQRNAAKLLLLATLLLCCLMIPLLFAVDLLEDSFAIYCWFKPEFLFVETIYLYTFYLYGPVAGVLIFNIAICSLIVKRRLGKTSATSRSNVNETRITLLLMVISIMFVATVGFGNLMGQTIFKDVSYVEQQIISMMNVLYSLNVIFNTWILMVLPAMRQALKEGLNRVFCFKCRILRDIKTV